MRRLILPVTCILFMSLIACEKYIIEAPDIEPGISFADQVQPIFTPDGADCVNCHSGGRPPDLRPENSYDALIDGGYVDTDDPESSVLYTKLRGTHDSRATEEQKLTILQWITEGALNN